jgi:hypothetical protein
MKRAAKIIFIIGSPFSFLDPLQAFYNESGKKSQGLAPPHSGDIYATRGAGPETLTGPVSSSVLPRRIWTKGNFPGPHAARPISTGIAPDPISIHLKSFKLFAFKIGQSVEKSMSLIRYRRVFTAFPQLIDNNLWKD